MATKDNGGGAPTMGDLMAEVRRLSERLTRLHREVSRMAQGLAKEEARWLSTAQVAEMLGYKGGDQVRRLIEDGKLGSVSLDGRYRVPESEVRRFMAAVEKSQGGGCLRGPLASMLGECAG